MDDKKSVSRWISKVKTGDQEAARDLWQHYYYRLKDFCLRKLKMHNHLCRDADEEDVALLVFQTVFRRAKKGEFQQLSNRDDLWKLLVKIAGRKAAKEIRREFALKRGEGEVQGESGFDSPALPENEQGIQQLIGPEPTPEFAALMTEECERLVQSLGDETLQRIVELKLEGYTNDEIKDTLDCSLRTVERKLKRIRNQWSHKVSGDE